MENLTQKKAKPSLPASILTLAVFCLLLLTAQPLAADETPSTIVTTTQDIVDPTDNLISLREAINYASSGGTITFNIAEANPKITLSSATGFGTLNVTKDLNIIGTNTNALGGKVILDGGDTYNGTTIMEHSGVRIMSISEGYTVLLENLTFQNGYISNSSGGAIINFGTLSIVNSTFTENTANNSGGAIFNYQETLSIVNSTFTGNNAYNGGGAIYNKGDACLLNSILVGNTATNGGDYYDNNGSINIACYSLFGNVTSNSGAIGLGVFSNSTGSQAEVTKTDVFGSDSPTLDPDGTFHIYQRGAACGRGVFVWHDANWQNIAYSETYNGTKTAVCGDAVSANTFLNKDQTGQTIQTDCRPSIGSYYVSSETSSTIVTTAQDIVDPTDNLISLREAVNYAGTPSGMIISYDITFNIQNENNPVIILSSTLSIGKSITINGENRKNLSGVVEGGYVVLDGGRVNNSGGVRIMNIASGKTVSLENLTYQNGYDYISGGAIYNYGTLSVVNSTFTGNTADMGGGAIYNEGTLSVVNSTLTGNTTNYHGGAIYNEGTLSVVNSTFTGNTANDLGGAIYNYGTLSVVSSTFTGNYAYNGGGAIYNKGDACLLNSILVGNTATNGGDYYDNNGSINIACYSLFGNVGGDSGAIGLEVFSNSTGSQIGITKTQVFGSNSPTLDPDGTFHIYQRGAACGRGVFVRHDANWQNIAYSETYNGTKTAVRGSEASANIFLNKDQTGQTIQTDCLPSIGSYYVSSETPSTIVTTAQDIVDPTDNLISLREAVNYAGTHSGMIISYDITFNIQNVNNPVIILSSTLSIGKSITINGENRKNLSGVVEGGYVVLDGGRVNNTGGVQIMNIAGGKNVSLENLTFQNGYDYMRGGAIYNNGTLSVVNSTFTGNIATSTELIKTGNGGAIYNLGTLSVVNSTFTGNIATSTELIKTGNGGAIYNLGTLSVINSTFTGNTAAGNDAVNGYGGAIYNYGTLSVVNSTFTGNTANRSGGAIYNLGTLSVVNSTFTGNTANRSGGAICNDNGNAYLLNSILAGNTATNGGDYYDNNGSTNIAFYSLFGEVESNSGTTGLSVFSNSTGSQIGITKTDVFGSDSPTLDPDGTFHIYPRGEACGKGVFVWHDANWQNIAYSETYNGTKTAVRGSEASANIFLNKDQTGQTIQTDCMPSIGSYYVKPPEAPSVCVTTSADIVDPNDNLISLREAVRDAGMSFGLNTLPNDITFDIAETNPKITLSSATGFGTLIIDKDLSIDGTNLGGGKVILDGGDTYNGTTVTTHSGVRIMNIATGKNVSLENLTFQNGYISNSSGGAIINFGTLSIVNSTFTENTANNSGGAIFNYQETLSIVNSTFTGNTANSLGGAIYNIKNVHCLNSILVGNTAAGGGDYHCGTNNSNIACNSLFGNVKNSSNTTGLSVFSNSTGSQAGITKTQVFGTDTPALNADGTFHIHNGSAAQGAGVFVWHNEDWLKIAYSTTVNGTKTYIVGIYEEGDNLTMLATDQIGQPILTNCTPSAGAYYYMVGTIVFNGGYENGSCNNTSNWSTGSLPNANDNVIINADAMLDVDVQVSSLVVETGHAMTISTGKTLTVNELLVNNSGNNDGIVIKENASLIHHSAGVSGKVEVNIDNSSREERGESREEGEWTADWHFISSPVVEQGISDGSFACQADGGNYDFNYDFYLYDEPSYTWINYKNSDFADYNVNDNFTVGRGYFAAYETGGVKTFSGNLNHGETSIPLTASGNALQGFNLVGNPYPSYIDWDASGWNRSNLYGYATENSATAYYVYNEDYHNYSVYVENGGVGTNNGSRYIAPGQGFFVKAASAGNLVMNDGVRVAVPEGGGLRGGKSDGENIIIRISGKSGQDEVMINFGENKNFAAEKMFSMEKEAPSLYLPNYGENYSIINGRDARPCVSTIPMNFEAGVMGQYMIMGKDMPWHVRTVILEDLQSGIKTDLLSESYTFIGMPSDDPARFLLHFTIEDANDELPSESFAYFDGNDLIVGGISGKAVIDVIDVQGRILYRFNANGSSVETHGRASVPSRITSLQIPTGTYIIRKIDDSGVKNMKAVKTVM